MGIWENTLVAQKRKCRDINSPEKLAGPIIEIHSNVATYWKDDFFFFETVSWNPVEP